MMQNIRKQKKGIFLINVGMLLLLIALAVTGMLTVLNTRIRQYQKHMDRTLAYYLCETGLSFAILDINMERVQPGSCDPTSPPGTCERTYSFTVGGTAYPITYDISKVLLEYSIDSSVPSPFGLGCTYHLHLGSVRGFPWFIRGKAH